LSMLAPSTFSILVCLTLTLGATFPRHAPAQSVDQCMTSKGNTAVSVCQKVLDNGSRSASVYYQLSSQLHQIGKTTQALSTIDKALSTHPGNSLLTDLKNRIISDADEDEAIKRSAEKNQVAMSRGQLKITCLTKSGTTGLRACRGYLAQTNVDGDRIRARENKLVNQIGSIQVTPPTPTPTPIPAPTPKPDDTIIATNTERTENPAPAPRKQPDNAVNSEQRQLTKDLQIQLSALGFNVGVPDGIAGRKTRTALADFYRLANKPASTALNAATLDEVRTANDTLSIAENQLQNSRQLASEGRLTEALTQLNAAERTSVFLSVPTGYRQNLDLQIAQLQLDNNAPKPEKPDAGTTVTQTPPKDTPSNTAPTTPPATTVVQTELSDEQYSQLLAQINVLESRLNLRQSNNRRQNQLVRDTVSAVFSK